MSISRLGGQVSKMYSAFKPTSAKKGAGLLYNKAALRLSKVLAQYDEGAFQMIKMSFPTPGEKVFTLQARLQEARKLGLNLQNIAKKIHEAIGLEVPVCDKNSLAHGVSLADRFRKHLNTRSVKELQQIVSATKV